MTQLNTELVQSCIASYLEERYNFSQDFDTNFRVDSVTKLGEGSYQLHVSFEYLVETFEPVSVGRMTNEELEYAFEHIQAPAGIKNVLAKQELMLSAVARVRFTKDLFLTVEDDSYAIRSTLETRASEIVSLIKVKWQGRIFGQSVSYKTIFPYHMVTRDAIVYASDLLAHFNSIRMYILCPALSDTIDRLRAVIPLDDYDRLHQIEVRAVDRIDISLQSFGQIVSQLRSEYLDLIQSSPDIDREYANDIMRMIEDTEDFIRNKLVKYLERIRVSQALIQFSRPALNTANDVLVLSDALKESLVAFVDAHKKKLGLFRSVNEYTISEANRACEVFYSKCKTLHSQLEQLTHYS